MIIPCGILYPFLGVGHGASEIVRICKGEGHKMYMTCVHLPVM